MDYSISIDSHIGPWGYSKNYILATINTNIIDDMINGFSVAR